MTDIRMATFNLYIVPNTYSERGWDFNLIEEGKWNPYSEDATNPEINILVGTYQVPLPSETVLVDMGMAQVDKLKEALVIRQADETARIKEYESKFLLLPCYGAP